MKLSQISRRSFVKAAAVAGATAASPFSPAFSAGTSTAQKPADSQKDDTQIITTTCRACIHNCGVRAHVRNSRVIKIEGDPNYPMTDGTLCAKGLSGINALYHPDRNKYPMIRVGERGENKWKRISWDEAIDIIAHKMMEAREKYGAESVMASTGGGGNPHFRMIARFCNIFGTPNWYEPGCAQCFLPRTLAFGMMYGGPSTSIADECALEIYNKNTPMKNIVLWGTDVSYSCPAGGGHALANLRAKGVKTVSVDPRFAPSAAKADVWLPVRPGTDVALQLAWIRYIIAHNLFDKDFVLKWTNLPYLVDTKTKMTVKANELFKDGKKEDFVVWDTKTNQPQPLPYPWNDNLDPVLDGEFTYNGKTYKTGFRLLKERAEPWTLEKAGETCWLKPEKIEEAIKIYAEGPGGISLGVATDQNPNSVQAAMGAVILNALMGYVEKPGTLMNRNPLAVPPKNSLVSRCERLLPPGQLAKRLGGVEFKGLLSWDAAQPSRIQEAIMTGKPYPIKVWLERSGNKLGVVGDAGSWAEATKHVDFIVHMFNYPTSFSMYADMLLPTTEWLETDFLAESLNTVWARQAVVHTWETRHETVIWSKILKRCGELGHEVCRKSFDPEFMGADLPQWDSMDEILDLKLKPLNITFAELKKKGFIEAMPYDKWNSYYVYKKINPKTGLPVGFGTASKKLELYTDRFITMGRTGAPYALQKLDPVEKDYDPLPYYVEPYESPNREIAKEYPLVMTNGRLPMFHHSTLRNIPYLREIYPVPEVWINPETAAKYGIKQGDWTWIESKRGKTQGKARLTEGINPGVLYMERFWFPEKLASDTHGWKEANVNVLSKNTAPFNDMVGTYTLRGYQVRISKADKGPEGVWTKPEQFKVWMPAPSENTPKIEG